MTYYYATLSDLLVAVASAGLSAFRDRLAEGSLTAFGPLLDIWPPEALGDFWLSE